MLWIGKVVWTIIPNIYGWPGFEEPELHDDPALEGEREEGGRATGVADKHSN